VHIVKYAAYADASVEATATAAAATAAAAAAEHPRTGALIENDQTERAAPLHRAEENSQGNGFPALHTNKTKLKSKYGRFQKNINSKCRSEQVIISIKINIGNKHCVANETTSFGLTGGPANSLETSTSI